MTDGTPNPRAPHSLALQHFLETLILTFRNGHRAPNIQAGICCSDFRLLFNHTPPGNGDDGDRAAPEVPSTENLCRCKLLPRAVIVINFFFLLMVLSCTSLFSQAGVFSVGKRKTKTTGTGISCQTTAKFGIGFEFQQLAGFFFRCQARALTFDQFFFYLGNL